MPGTRSVLRRPTHSSSGSSRGYTGVTSRESLPRRPILASMSRAVVREQPVPQNASSSPSWPLPRRLTRSNATPLVKLRAPSLTPITEKSAKKLGKDIAVAIDVQPFGVDKDKAKIQLPAPDAQESFQPDTITTTVLKLKPLFHDKPRSSSASALAQWSNNAQVSEAIVSDREKALPTPRFPRSSSLYSQQPGLAPEKPMPPLPSNLPVPKRISSIKSLAELSSRRTSGNRLFSGDTYILSKFLHSGSGKDLRKSIMYIRRMNNEAADLQPKQLQRYLSIGRTRSTIFEDDAVLQDIFGEIQGKAEQVEKDSGGRAAKDMPLSSATDDCELSTPKKKVLGLTWGSPRSLYDPSGFLRDG